MFKVHIFRSLSSAMLCRFSEPQTPNVLQVPQASLCISPSTLSPKTPGNHTYHLQVLTSFSSVLSFNDCEANRDTGRPALGPQTLILTITHQTLPHSVISCLCPRRPPSIPSDSPFCTYLTEGGRLEWQAPSI